MAFDKALQAGSTEMMLLSLLEKNDMYGYELIEKIKLKSQGEFELKAGTLYPLLHLLEQKGYVISYNSDVSRGKPRKYYQITEEGKIHVRGRVDEWSEYVAAVERVLGLDS